MYKLEYRVLDLGISQLVTRSVEVRGNVPWKISADSKLGSASATCDLIVMIVMHGEDMQIIFVRIE